MQLYYYHYFFSKRIAISANNLLWYDLSEYGYVAQLDRASDSGSEGRGFESLHTRKSN